MGRAEVPGFIALPEVELSERLGQRGIELQRKARGTGTRTLVPSDSTLVFEEVMEVEFPLVLLEPLAFLLKRMLEQLCARLQARALAAQELRLELTLEDGQRSCAVADLNIETTKGHEVRRNAAETLWGIINPVTNGKFQRTIHLPVPMLDSVTFLKLLQLDLKSHPPGAPV